MGDRAAVEVRGTWLARLSAVMAILASIFFLLVPAYESHRLTAGSGGGVVVQRGDGKTLLQHEGLRAVVLLALPPAIAGAALLPRKRRTVVIVRAATAISILAFSVIGAASIGMFFIPSGVLMALAAVAAARS
jgi:hypothetical protein